MISGDYRDLFGAIAAAAGALTGLLFVAISVAPRGSSAGGNAVVQEVRAAASLLAFTNALAVALFGLVPNQNIGYPATVLGVIGVLFAAAAIRSIFVPNSPQPPRRWRQVGWIALILATFAFELDAGIDLLLHPRSLSPLDLLSNLLIVSLLIGVARAWELVGRRDTGIIASLAVLAGRDPTGPNQVLQVADPGPSGDPR